MTHRLVSSRLVKRASQQMHWYPQRARRPNALSWQPEPSPFVCCMGSDGGRGADCGLEALTAAGGHDTDRRECDGQGIGCRICTDYENGSDMYDGRCFCALGFGLSSGFASSMYSKDAVAFGRVIQNRGCRAFSWLALPSMCSKNAVAFGVGIPIRGRLIFFGVTLPFSHRCHVHLSSRVASAIGVATAIATLTISWRW